MGDTNQEPPEERRFLGQGGHTILQECNQEPGQCILQTQTSQNCIYSKESPCNFNTMTLYDTSMTMGNTLKKIQTIPDIS